LNLNRIDIAVLLTHRCPLMGGHHAEPVNESATRPPTGMEECRQCREGWFA
jgi:hypothetical protein